MTLAFFNPPLGQPLTTWADMIIELAIEKGTEEHMAQWSNDHESSGSTAPSTGPQERTDEAAAYQVAVRTEFAWIRERLPLFEVPGRDECNTISDVLGEIDEMFAVTFSGLAPIYERLADWNGDGATNFEASTATPLQIALIEQRLLANELRAGVAAHQSLIDLSRLSAESIAAAAYAALYTLGRWTKEDTEFLISVINCVGTAAAAIAVGSVTDGLALALIPALIAHIGTSADLGVKVGSITGSSVQEVLDELRKALDTLDESIAHEDGTIRVNLEKTLDGIADCLRDPDREARLRPMRPWIADQDAVSHSEFFPE